MKSMVLPEIDLTDKMVHLSRSYYAPRGTFLTCIRNPGYPDCWCTGTYHEIAAPERLAFSMALCDEDGTPLDSSAAGKDPDWPAETIVIVEFVEDDGQTTLTLHQNALESVAVRTGAHAGWVQMLERLADQLV